MKREDKLYDMLNNVSLENWETTSDSISTQLNDAEVVIVLDSTRARIHVDDVLILDSQNEEMRELVKNVMENSKKQKIDSAWLKLNLSDD